MSVEHKLSTRETIKKKSEFYKKIRDFFLEIGVMEVITSPFRKAPPTDVFLDHFECKAFNDHEVFYMHSSPEYAMKQIIMQGSGDIFQICQVARGNEHGAWHSKTFTMLEWYRINKDMIFLINESIKLLQSLLDCKTESIKLSYQQSYAQLANIANVHNASLQELQEYFLRSNLSFETSWTKDDYLHNIMSAVIEPKLQKYPITVIYDFPASQAALAKTSIDTFGNEVADRFEIYCYGIEVGNGYNELTCAYEHKKRFAKDQEQRQIYSKPTYAIDQDFILQLTNSKMPDTVGIAMGLDRIFALANNSKGLVP